MRIHLNQNIDSLSRPFATQDHLIQELWPLQVPDTHFLETSLPNWLTASSLPIQITMIANKGRRIDRRAPISPRIDRRFEKGSIRRSGRIFLCSAADACRDG